MTTTHKLPSLVDAQLFGQEERHHQEPAARPHAVARHHHANLAKGGGRGQEDGRQARQEHHRRVGNVLGEQVEVEEEAKDDTTAQVKDGAEREEERGIGAGVETYEL